MRSKYQCDTDGWDLFYFSFEKAEKSVEKIAVKNPEKILKKSG